MAVVCDVLNSFGLHTEPLQIVAVVQGDLNADGNSNCVELGRRTTGKFAGHWVTIVEGRFLVDPTLGQARTKLNPQLEAYPLAIDFSGFTWFNEAGEPIVLEVGLSPNTKVT
jgi:hypothetical protein